MSENNNQENEQIVETYVDVTPEGNQNTPGVNNKGFGIASLVLGITAVFPGCCCAPYGMFILGALAIIFGVLFLNANKEIAVGKGMGRAGFILGIIAIILAIILTVLTLLLPGFVDSTDYQEYIEEFLEDQN